MTGLQEMIFISEIALQSKIALRSLKRISTSYNNSDQVEVWSSIQSFLVATGNVSKILWPGLKYTLRGKKLRHVLGVENGNLLCDRKFRNHFEHYDERIEEWFINRPGGSYVDLAMNPSFNSFFWPPSAHRGYNSFNNTLLFRGELLDLNQVQIALEEIFNKCKPYILESQRSIE